MWLLLFFHHTGNDLGYVLDLGEKGFRKDLIDNCISIVKQEISALVSSFKFDNSVKVVEDYSEESPWLQFA